jgi:SAM-dependent methyltransferase
MSGRLAGSFRDPAGFVFRRDGTLYRQINVSYMEDYSQLMSSGLYDELTSQGLLIPHRAADVLISEPGLGHLVIQPDEVRFISYPYEWSPGQLLAAAEATLLIQQLAMRFGMSLRDASAYNIQFHRGQPTLIDSLSFERIEDGAPWKAYNQYCRHFLAPLALMKHVDVRLSELLRTEIDGVPLDLASRLLPPRTRLHPGLALHIHGHSGSQQRHAADDAPTRAHKPQRISRRALAGLIDSLAATTAKQRWKPRKSDWRDYYQLQQSYTEVAQQHKIDIVGNIIKSQRANSVCDLGANTGRFSNLAAATGADVLAVEMDVASVELHWQALRSDGNGGVLPLVSDLSNPSPAQGWAHTERMSLEERVQVDVVLALALVHHLAIGNNVPLRNIFDWFARLGSTVIVEWIPKDDPMVQHLLSSRTDIFDDYHIQAFEDAARGFFETVDCRALPASSRSIYVMRRLP